MDFGAFSAQQLLGNGHQLILFPCRARVYSRENATYLYFLIRCDDDIRYNNPTSSNWANDCVEFYIDPGIRATITDQAR